MIKLCQRTVATADEQIRVSDRVKRELDRRRREDESYNDVLKRLLEEREAGDFYDGFGRWTGEQAERVRERRDASKRERKERMRRLTDESR